MPGKERLVEIVSESTKKVRIAVNNFDSMAAGPQGLDAATVDTVREHAHQAVDKAADACKVLVREGQNG